MRVEVHDAQGMLVGYLKSKLVSWSGGFHVYDREDRPFAEVTGNLIGFTYRMVTPDGAVELGRVSKQWKGFTREVFTSADWYLVEVNEDLDEQLAKGAKGWAGRKRRAPVRRDMNVPSHRAVWNGCRLGAGRST